VLKVDLEESRSGRNAPLNRIHDASGTEARTDFAYRPALDGLRAVMDQPRTPFPGPGEPGRDPHPPERTVSDRGSAGLDPDGLLRHYQELLREFARKRPADVVLVDLAAILCPDGLPCPSASRASASDPTAVTSRAKEPSGWASVCSRRWSPGFDDPTSRGQTDSLLSNGWSGGAVRGRCRSAG
jgi:hypothetical protein